MRPVGLWPIKKNYRKSRDIFKLEYKRHYCDQLSIYLCEPPTLMWEIHNLVPSTHIYKLIPLGVSKNRKHESERMNIIPRKYCYLRVFGLGSAIATSSSFLTLPSFLSLSWRSPVLFLFDDLQETVLWLREFSFVFLWDHITGVNYFRGQQPTVMDLPLEILPEIFSHIVMPRHLASLYFVSNAFWTFTVCELYK